MKTKILIDATGGRSWIGGLYYKKNVVFAMLQNKDFVHDYEIVLATERENISIFKCFEQKVKLVAINYKKEKEKKIKLLLLGLLNRCKFIFPYWGKSHFKQFGIKEIYWVADFQECHYPEYFSESSIQERRRHVQRIVDDKSPIILSSEDCYKDLQTYFGKTENVAVMHFVSYIEEEIKVINESKEASVLSDKDLKKGRYFCVCNQFWQHKNHVVILEAMKLFFEKNPDSEIQFVFTGELKDYRNQQYFELLMGLFQDELIKKHSKLLGFISREEQVILIKNAKAVIQPSLFEGWGTVLEDAKVMDQTVVLSDIPVHREQMNQKCFLFQPNEASDLCRVISEVLETDTSCEIENGIRMMYQNAEHYADAFVQLLKNNSKG